MTSKIGRGWHFWIDRGGTFTDVVARSPDGSLRTLKVLSECPAQYSDAAVHAVEQILREAAADQRSVAAVKMGTTVATNALLERRGARTALVITAGLADALEIGNQSRPDIFALNIELPQMLYDRVIEAPERVTAAGKVLEPLDETALGRELAAAREAGFTSVAIVLLHSYRYPEHERRAARLARELGFEQISASHEVSPLMKLVPRGDTTLVDAYLSPVLKRYVEQLRVGLATRASAATLHFMQSHGGLVRAEQFRGRDSILSGPAGGVVGMAHTAMAAGFRRLIGFDMGGTSTDVSLYDGAFDRTGEALIAGVRIAAPMMSIHTVAAGGGSITRFAEGRLLVGPGSAGATPGPACYGAGGPLTITDANVLLGRIQPDFFPCVFGAHADQPIDGGIVRSLFSEVAAQVGAESPQAACPERLAWGFLAIAVERMASAIKRISVQRGHDVTQFTLACFGGAGGQHACQVADALGIETVLIHPLAGLLSAYGMGLADTSVVRQAAVEQPLTAHYLEALAPEFQRLREQAAAELAEQGVMQTELRFVQRVALRLAGSDTALTVPWLPASSQADLVAAFHASHAEHFGFSAEGHGLVVDSLEVEAIGAVPKPAEPLWPAREAASPVAVREVWFADGWLATPIYRREELAAAQRIAGPAVIAEKNATTVVELGWEATLNEWGHLLLKRSSPRATVEASSTDLDPIRLEIFNHLFMHIAEQMGVVLEKTAHSVNIKERLDFSCALFDEAGELIANAPHMPVHLGSMGDSVQTLLRAHSGSIKSGDVYMLNAPYNGGTHLPDITVVTPLCTAAGRVQFVLACRAHHADVGGISPGSMPAHSRSIEEEGVLLDDVTLVREDRFLEHAVRRLLTSGPYPARNPDQNIADLKAQIAANTKGARELRLLIERYGLAVVQAYMGHIKANAEECVRQALDLLSDGSYAAELDGGECVAVAVSIDRTRRQAVIDFAGTSPPSPSNFNAPVSIARAAVLYVFRTLIKAQIPLNAGCLKPLILRVPEPSLLSPRYPAAVVAGNVETSQVIVDVLLAALGASAAAQGTMNNFTFGNARYQYYETLCGGAGAGASFDGASAVHTHMTNSRLTDIEVLEWRYPVRVRTFAIRRGSGGPGRYRGGDGIVRELVFEEAVEASLLANRRRVAPFGLAGGGEARPGRNYVRRRDGAIEMLGNTARVLLEPGDAFVIETPGGGGYGAASRSRSSSI